MLNLPRYFTSILSLPPHVYPRQRGLPKLSLLQIFSNFFFSSQFLFSPQSCHIYVPMSNCPHERYALANQFSLSISPLSLSTKLMLNPADYFDYWLSERLIPFQQESKTRFSSDTQQRQLPSCQPPIHRVSTHYPGAWSLSSPPIRHFDL